MAVDNNKVGDCVAPVRERGLKSNFVSYRDLSGKVAPVRERGLKLSKTERRILACGRSRKGAWIEIRTSNLKLSMPYCRSRKGAWIEIIRVHRNKMKPTVAPVRERGLK